MACLINDGLVRDCGFSFGGLQALYLAPKSVISGYTYSTGGTITAVTGGAGEFFTYDAEPNTAQLLQELQTGAASRFVNQTINGQFSNINQAKKEVLNDLANAYVVAIVKDQAGRYWLAGESGRGLLAASLSIDSGAAEADAAVATISLVGGSLGFANEVSSSIIAALLAP